MRNRLPRALVLSVAPTSTTRLVVVACPVCHRKHTHGWPYSTDTIGARVAHCVTRNVLPGAPGSYFIPTPSAPHPDIDPSRDEPTPPAGQAPHSHTH